MDARVKPTVGDNEAADVDDADVTVVGGAGHVGIPMVLALAEAGFCVNVNDRNRGTLETLRRGQLPFIEADAGAVLAKALRDKRLIFSDAAERISTGGPVIVTIGTPVDEFGKPARQEVQDCIDALLPAMADGQLLILRSTVFPGTTAWLASHLKTRGRDIKLAYCPERIVQGAGLKELRELPQIVSGCTPEAEEEAAALFERIAPEVVRLTPGEAEFAKLFANAYRYIEFAVSNEFYMLAKAAGVDYQRVLSAMKHNYPRLKGLPRPGYAAGPCLVKDTRQLAAFAGGSFELCQAALAINEGLVPQVIEDLKRRFDLPTMTVGLLGMAFKAESDDARGSLSYRFKTMLSGEARAVVTTDPFVAGDPDLRRLDETIAQSDVLILCTPHAAYRQADFRGKPVFDIWGLLAGDNVIR